MIYLIWDISLHRDTTITGIKMAVTTKSRNAHTFNGKSSDFHLNTQQKVDVFRQKKRLRGSYRNKRHFRSSLGVII